MAAPAKFLFDDDFASQAVGKPTVSLADHATKLKEAEAAGYGKGFAAAQAEAKLDSERRSITALERIAAALEALKGDLSATEAKLEAEAVQVAVAVGRKLASELIAREPFAEISALTANCFRHLVAAPHIVVRVSDREHGTASAKLDELVRTRGLESRLVVLAESDIAPGDCRIEWADGGITRDRAATESAIDEAVDRYVNARIATATMKNGPWSPSL